MEILRTLKEQVDPKHTALMVIDAQNDFLHSNGYVPVNFGVDLPRLQKILPALNDFVEF